MKLKSKLMAAAIALVAASGAHAAIDGGSTINGNGELFFNIWDATGSYTRDLNLSINSFESTVSAGGAIHLTYAADSLLTDYFAGTSGGGARSGTLNFNIFANDAVGAGVDSRRMFTTFTEPTMSPTITSTAARTGNTNTQTFVTAVNTAMGANQSVAVLNTNAAAAGKTFKDKASGTLNFSNAGTLANNSYEDGLSFMYVGANSLGSTLSTYNQLFDAGSEIHVYMDAANTLHIQAIPEPSEYALMLAGLGMLGFMARRRLNNRA